MNTTNFDGSPFDRAEPFTPVLTGELWDLTQQILRAQGRQRFFKDWDTELTGRVVSRAVPPNGVMLNPRPGRPELRLQVTRIPARRTRRLDYRRLHTERTDLYERFVTETTPNIPLRLTLRAAEHMTKSQQWDAIRGGAWQEMNATLGEMRAESLKWVSLNDIGTKLREVRDRAKTAASVEEKARRELAARILELTHGRTDVVFRCAEGDGRLFTPAAPVTHKADLDAVEADPVARLYVRSSVVKETTRVWFQAEAHDPEGDADPFEGD
jgi:hypothetical protein